jgi:hypothetical protein
MSKHICNKHNHILPTMIPGTVSAPLRTSSFDGSGLDALDASDGVKDDAEFAATSPGKTKLSHLN